MRISSQTLKGHNSETVRPFEQNFFFEMYFDQLYLGSMRGLGDRLVNRDQHVEHASPNPTLTSMHTHIWKTWS
jgi:hypothetical protein